MGDFLSTQRLDIWLFRARLTKSRADAARLIGEGGVRVLREGQSRRLLKPSAEIAPGDTITFPACGQVRALHVLALGKRRGPPAEARRLYREEAGS